MSKRIDTYGLTDLDSISEALSTQNYGTWDKQSHTAQKLLGASCYHNHPPLPLGEFKIYGGSCVSPVVKDADIYVGFETGMKRSPKQYPWVSGESFLFHIVDGQPPADTDAAKALVLWLAKQVTAGKKVHIGCIGGHGRTGTILAALTKIMLGEVDAITYVRKHYCKKAVESSSQVEWLHNVYGITKVEGSKSHLSSTKSWTKDSVVTTGRILPKTGGLGELAPRPKTRFSLWGGNVL